MSEPLSFQVMPANWHDLNSLRQIEKACFPQDAWPLWDLMAVLTLPGVVRLKAVMGGEMVGFVAGDIRSSERVGWITTLGTLPNFRRHGIATALLHACESEMDQPCVKLSVRRSNQDAIDLYTREGYKQTSIWPGYYPGKEDGLILEKCW
ncbi:MAG TPA: GNAT family N-acetyltransferase [Anaerolineaceae bacterium]